MKLRFSKTPYALYVDTNNKSVLISKNPKISKGRMYHHWSLWLLHTIASTIRIETVSHRNYDEYIYGIRPRRKGCGGAAASFISSPPASFVSSNSTRILILTNLLSVFTGCVSLHFSHEPDRIPGAVIALFVEQINLGEIMQCKHWDRPSSGLIWL